MISGDSQGNKQSGFGVRLTIFCASATLAAIFACTAFLMLAAVAAQRDLPPNTLWEVVHSLCVPGQSLFQNPKPCLKVDLDGGVEKGFAILRDPRGGTQFLIVPTTRISGIESPIVREPHAANYFADAWESRDFIEDALHQRLPRDGVALAINSVVSRSQDQLHIHLSCIREDALDALHRNEKEGRIGDRWAFLNVSILGHRYMAMWVAGQRLDVHNPFRLLSEKLPDAAQGMGDHTLVVVGLTRQDGTKGFVILTDQVNMEKGDNAFGEELLDRDCHILAKGSKARSSLTGPESE